MELAQDKIDLIGAIIKSDRKYTGNESLYEDFLNEACSRSVSIAGVIEDKNTLEVYLKRVVSTSILTVLKDSGRLRRSKTGYVPRKEVSIDQPVEVAPQSVPQNPIPEGSQADYTSVLVRYSDIELPQTPESLAIQKDLISFVASAIKSIDEEFPEEKYLQLYELRYDKGLTQKEIAHELGISQSEVSKRLYTLMDKVKETMD